MYTILHVMYTKVFLIMFIVYELTNRAKKVLLNHKGMRLVIDIINVRLGNMLYHPLHAAGM